MVNKPKSPLTKEGYVRLRNERDSLLRVERPRVVQGVKEAAAEGDRSENAEYIYGKKKLREIDKRLQYLSGLLDNALVVETYELSGNKICFGSTVIVRDENGKERTFTIVGEGEVDNEQKISLKSPMAKALIGKRVGEVVEIHRPKDVAEFEVVALLFGDKLIAREE